MPYSGFGKKYLEKVASKKVLLFYSDKNEKDVENQNIIFNMKEIYSSNKLQKQIDDSTNVNNFKMHRGSIKINTTKSIQSNIRKIKSLTSEDTYFNTTVKAWVVDHLDKMNY